jgi:ATP-dependent Clp protease ATP-binding subunit ClpA
MNGYNFTERTRKVLGMAREEASRLRHEYVGTEHILLGLIREGDGVAATVLQNLNIDLDDMAFMVEQTVRKGPLGTSTGPDLPYTSRAKKVLELSMSNARDLNHSYVGTEHLLLGLLAEQKGIAAQVLTDRGVTLDTACAETLRILGTEMPKGEVPAPLRHAAEKARRIELPTETLVELIRASESVAREYYSAEATPVHATIALLRRGDGFAIAILDRLGCDRKKTLRTLEETAGSAERNAVAEKGAKLDDHLVEFLREMYQPWKIPVGTLDLLLFVLDKNPGVAAAFAEQGITANRVLEEGQRFSG